MIKVILKKFIVIFTILAFLSVACTSQATEPEPESEAPPPKPASENEQPENNQEPYSDVKEELEKYNTIIDFVL